MNDTSTTTTRVDNEDNPHTTPTTAPLEDTSHFTNALKEWVETDNKMTYYNQQLKECRQIRNQLTPSICNYMERQNLQNTKIQISDGTLHYGCDSVTPSFTQKFLLEGLIAFFEQKTNPTDGTQLATECLDFLKHRRVPEKKSALKRKYTTTTDDPSHA